MINLCEICKNTIPTTMVIDGKRRNLSNRKYCLSCSPFGKHNTKQLKLKTKNLKSLSSICINCECVFEYNSYVCNGKYCSNKCQQDFLATRYIEKWLNGDIVPSIYMSKYIRNYMLKEAHNKCSLCGWGEKNQYSHTYPLVIDHIDGNAEHTVYSNLRVICPNCDSLTSTYKGLNKGNGRKYRKEQYHKDKLKFTIS